MWALRGHRLVSLIYGRRLASPGSSKIRSLALVTSCLGLFPFVSTVLSSFHIIMILVSAPSSYFTLAVSMREVLCVGYTPREWDPRSLQSILNGLLYFRPLKWSPLFSILVNNVTKFYNECWKFGANLFSISSDVVNCPILRFK